jgi:starvation-inducible DNA-binding protein
MKPDIGINDKQLKKIISSLEIALANEMTLYVKTRKAHWNVTGESFMELHRLFEEHYKLLEAAIDEIAERIGKLGSKTIGTMDEFIKKSSLKEHPGKYNSSNDMLKELLKDHETVIKGLRDDVSECQDKYNDAGTADFLTGLMEEHETIAWVLRRYLNA